MPFARTIQIRLPRRYIVAFLALTLLCGLSHELVHHFVGGAVCGGLGTKSFNSFDLVPGCSLWGIAVANLAGPAFTFGLMWLGVVWLRSPDEAIRQRGFALIFANFPINRLLFVLLGFNDEYYVARLLLGNEQWVQHLAIVGTWLFALPPVVIGYFAIANHRRWAWFLGFFIIPFLIVFAFAGLFLEEYLLLDQKFLATTMLGIPWLIVILECLCLGIYFWFRQSLSGPATPHVAKAG
ncbi:MAG: hypothetical protein ACRCY3_03085 [Sphingorhabdus sp.]